LPEWNGSWGRGSPDTLLGPEGTETFFQARSSDPAVDILTPNQSLTAARRRTRDVPARILRTA
jgi:hypothetical protein